MGEAVSLYKDEFLKDDSAFYLIHLYIRAIFYIFAGNKKIAKITQVLKSEVRPK